MSAVDIVLANRVEQLTIRNEELEAQNNHLAKLLASSLTALSVIRDRAEDTVRHFTLAQRGNGKFDFKKLLGR